MSSGRELLLWFLAHWCVVGESAKLSPVILVPGVGGSRLQAKLDKPSTVGLLCEKKTDDYFTLWFSAEFVVPLVNQCWLDNVKPSYDPATRTTVNQPGVDVRVPGFGDPRYVEWLDDNERLVGYFNALGDALVGVGYVRNVSLRGAPYDFRKGPSESDGFFDDLRKLVEDTYALNGRKRVVFIAHSMGAPFVAIFLRRQAQTWKDKYMRAFISLNGVLGGSVKALKTYIMGDNLNEFFIPSSLLKQLQISSSSLPLLMPYTDIWKDAVLATTPAKNYSMLNIREFFIDIGFENGWEMRLDQLPYMTLDPPGVKTYCVYGTGVQTVSRLVYDKQEDFPGKPAFEYSDGDGTVNFEGLNACSLWQSKQKQKVVVQPFSKMDHSAILSDSRSLNYVTSILTK